MRARKTTMDPAFRPPRAGSADADRRVIRAALERLHRDHVRDWPTLRRAGYASPEEFSAEVTDLIHADSAELTPKLLGALFGGGNDAPATAGTGRLGRVIT
jgi:hypothetical protein